MKESLNIPRIREAWQPLSDRELSDDDCQRIAEDMSGFFFALRRMKAELDEIKKRKESEVVRDEQVVEGI